MNPYRHTTIAAAGATLLAATPLTGVFRTVSWLVYGIGVVAVVLGAALLTRHLRAAPWVQIASMFGALVLLLSWLFGGSTTLLGVIPTLGTGAEFANLLVRAGSDVKELAAPVPDTPGLLFTVAACLGLVAIVVDLLAVGLRQPALAGLPMLAIYSVPVAVRLDSVSWISFALAAGGFLWLLVSDHIGRVRQWGRRFTGDGRDVDIWEASPLAAAGRRLGLIGIVAAVVIPLAVPGMTAGLLDRIVMGGGFGTGPGALDGRSIDPIASLRGNLTQAELTRMLRIYTDDPNPGYLRLAVADQITREAARPRPPEQNRVIGDRNLPLPPADARGDVKRETHRATIQILGLQQGYLPAYGNTTDVGVDPDNGRWFHDDSTSVIWSRGTTRPQMRYDLRYVRYDYTADQLRGAGSVEPSDPAFRRYTEVPRNARVERLVDNLTSGEDTQYDQVRAIHDYFSKENGFEYSVNVNEGTSGSAVVDFLRKKQGYCQQYALTMTWMLRTAGIPARVAIGFTQGTREANGFTVSNQDAHAWVEVWFDGLGWVPFDPTPASGVRNDVNMAYAPNPHVPPPSPTATASAAAVPTQSAAPNPSRDQRDAGDNAAAGGGKDPGDPIPGWVYGLFWTLLVAGLLALPGARRHVVRRGRLRLARSADPDQRPAAAYAAWDELLDTLTDLDITHEPSDTPRGLAHRLNHARPPLIENARREMELLARATERASYSRTPMSTEQLPAALAAVSAELRGTATDARKFAAVAFPESVLREWRERLALFTRRARAGWETGWEAVSQRMPRRRREAASR